MDGVIRDLELEKLKMRIDELERILSIQKKNIARLNAEKMEQGRILKAMAEENRTLQRRLKRICDLRKSSY